MKVTFVGSGCWQGIPAPFSEDIISQNVEWGSKDFRFRTSLHIETSNGKSILIEMTPDIRMQSWKFKLKKPDAILVSHWHWDHFFGLLDLEWFAEKNKLKIYGNQITRQWYSNRMGHVPAEFITFDSYEPFVIDNIKITPILVDHVKQTDGFILEDIHDGGKFVYLADFHGIPEKTLAMINDVDAITIDATYLESSIDDDQAHIQRDEIMPLLVNIKAKEIILTNIGSYHGITHDNLIKKYSPHTIAYDGLTLIFKEKSAPNKN